METKESWEEIKGKGRVGEFLILDSLFFPAFAGHAFAWIGEEILSQRTQWEVGGRGHYGFMHNVEMCWKLDFDL